ncbi:hypothetical protein BDV09DRAFT_178553, partial [Aspergillus tetrazonus]
HGMFLFSMILNISSWLLWEADLYSESRRLFENASKSIRCRTLAKGPAPVLSVDVLPHREGWCDIGGKKCP